MLTALDWQLYVSTGQDFGAIVDVLEDPRQYLGLDWQARTQVHCYFDGTPTVPVLLARTRGGL